MERLDKLIASRLCISRKEVKALLRRGAVTLNGAVARSAEQKCAEGDELLVEGRRLELSRHCYLMLNKPAGVVCATRDKQCGTVLDLVPAELRRSGLFPAGRLDKDTEGFVLLTDDGAFAHRILAPRQHVPKTYLARLNAPIDLEQLARAFGEGVELDGERLRPARLRGIEEGAQPLVELTICEGKFHQVKRMFALYSREVLHLRRIRIGALALDPALPPGGCRALTAGELEQLSSK